MSIKRTIIVTAAIVASVAMVAPTFAGAVTIADLQAQINALLAQLSALQGGSQTAGTGGTGACTGITFTRNLVVGSTGSDVKCLQQVLNQSATTQVAVTGAGSPGNETTYFGQLTLTAVKKYQTAHGWTPANQVGPLTRAALNASLGAVVIPGQPPVVTPSGSISATLAYSTPAAGAVIGSQATADMLHINFTGTGTVTSVTLQRSGISDQNLFTNVYLYDGNTRITDGYSFNVSGQLVMNGLSIAVNGSHIISVRADVMASASATQGSAVITLTGYTANGATMSANVAGNSMAVVSGSLASAWLAANTMATTANVNAGTTQYTFWTDSLQINTRAVLLKTANFKMIGSAPTDALSNIKLFIDGVDSGKVATIAAINGSNYAMFDLTSAPLTLTTGSHTIDVRANIEKGTNRTIQLSVAQSPDLTVTDPQVGVNIAVLGAAGVAFSANSGTNVTILTGSATVVVDPSFTSQTTISGGATNAVIARFKVHAYGEDVKVSSLNVIPSILGATSTGATCTTDGTTGALATGTCGLNNVTLYFNGSQVGSQVNYAAATYTMGTVTTGTAIAYSLGSQVIIPAGQDSILEVRADLQTSGSIAYTGGTIKVGLPLETTNGQGMSSQSTIAVPTAAVATNGLTIGSGGLQVAANSSYLSQAISPSTANVKIGSYILQNQSTSQSIRLTSLSIVTTTSTATINNFSALRTSDTTGAGSTPVQFSGTGTGTTSTDVFSVNDILAAGATMTIDIFANTGSATTGSIATTLNVSSIGSVDNIAATSGAKTGQTLTLGTGTIATPTIVTASTTPAQYVASSILSPATNASQATFSFISTSGAATISELKFTVSGSDADPSNTVTNICVGSVCASPVAGIADLTGLSLIVPNGGSGLTQSAQISYSGVGTGGIIPGMGSTVSLTYVKYSSGGTTTTISPSVAANMVTLVGSKPTVTVATGGNTGMVLGASTKVGQVTVTADAKGDIKLNKLTFSIGYSGYTVAPTSTSAEYIALGGQTTAISGSSCADSSSAAVETCTFGTGYDSDFRIGAGQSQQFDLYMTNDNGSNTTAGSIARISSSLTSAGFVWDDTSANGVLSEGVARTGALIYGFPTNSYSVSQ